jgi:hypothetical protein
VRSSFVSFVTFCSEIILTGANRDNGGLEQLILSRRIYQNLKSKAKRAAPPFSLLPPVQKIFFTGANGDNGGLEQLILSRRIYQNLKSKAKRAAPPFPLLPPVKTTESIAQNPPADLLITNQLLNMTQPSGQVFEIPEGSDLNRRPAHYE